MSNSGYYIVFIPTIIRAVVIVCRMVVGFTTTSGISAYYH